MATDTHRQSQTPLYPLRFEPIYQVSLWGRPAFGRLLTAPLPGDGPIGEAWYSATAMTTRASLANGPLKGRTIGQLLKQWPEQVLENWPGAFAGSHYC